MPNNIIIINCYIGCSSPYIYQYNTSFFLIFGKYSIRWSQWLKNHILNSKICFTNTFLNILCSCNLSYNNMKKLASICFAHTYWTLNTGFVIDNKVLRNNMNNLFPYLNMYFMHIFYQPEYVLFLNLIVIRFTHNISTILHTLSMLDPQFRQKPPKT